MKCGVGIMQSFIFPKDFLWGTTTSAYQIEGAWNIDGKGESVWDRYTHIPGKIVNNDNGDVACDHYHLYKEDVKLLRELGVQTYMFSIAWPRIFPNGSGIPNKQGMDFYKNLVALLNDGGIRPMVNLFHWEMPQKLQDAGGWANRETAFIFERYVRFVFRELGDRVPYWITFSEPWVSSFVSYWFGGHPPGIRDYSAAMLAAHNIMLAHGMSINTFRDMGLNGEIGISLNLNPAYPASEKSEDFDAADRYAEFLNGWFLDPILKGKYPIGLVKWLQGKVIFPDIEERDMKIINAPIDFLGINSYSCSSIMHSPNSWPLEFAYADTGKARTDSGWEIYPEGLYDLLAYLKEAYGNLKIFITENGAAFTDTVNENSEIDDFGRLHYLRDHILQVHRAIGDGVNVAGYSVWSFLDNFEWNSGYTKRFGLVYIDYETRKRTIKKSGYWYKDVIARGGIHI